MPSYGRAATAALAARDLWAWSGPGGNGGHGGGGPEGPPDGNSLSPLGTPQNPTLPHWFTNNPMPQGRPWGPRNTTNTNYYNDWPQTGVTRYYDWTVSKVPCSPDGFENTCLLVNNQFPGPTIEANWGDWIEVTVRNNISDEGTGLHWHGLLQKQTPWMDGVPAFSQCPIAPGKSFTYRFQAELYGTSWWHSHWSAQYGSGLWGPMVFYGPSQLDYDVDLGPIMLSDYYHEYYTAAVDLTLAPPLDTNPPLASNNMINGKASAGTGPMASFNFTSGKTYRLRVVNSSGASSQIFTIDNHTFTVIAQDFVPLEPYEEDHLTLAVGQRNDVLVKATGSPSDSVWMRSFRPPACGPSAANEEVQAAIFYEDADRSVQPTSQPGPNAYNTYCGNDPLSQTKPLFPLAIPEPEVTEIIPIEYRPNGSDVSANGTALVWYLANRTAYFDYNDPILLEAKLGNLDYPYIQNVHNYGTNSSIRLVFENTGSQPHPMHLHGHNLYILAEGPCTNNQTVFGHGTNYGSCWDGSIVNPQNPSRRDVHMLLPGQYLVVQWLQDNPGAWPFHCHIAWHLAAGFVWSVLERPGEIQQDMQIPSIMAQTCRDWAAYTGSNVVDQIDDGI